VWSAAILVGGQARRFRGRDKGTLVVGGRTILERQMAELTTLTDDIMIVGRRDRPPPAPARAIADRLPRLGPLGGLHTALSEARGEATIVIACDMPYVSRPFLGRLLELTGDADAVVPRTTRGYHPLCAAYTRACLARAAARLAEGRLKLLDLLEDLRLRVVTEEEIGVFGPPDRLLANVNSPADYVGLELVQGHQL
jgi:molybdopterin-guanine dinucleotide biosynthesis protein A